MNTVKKFLFIDISLVETNLCVNDDDILSEYINTRDFYTQ